VARVSYGMERCMNQGFSKFRVAIKCSALGRLICYTYDTDLAKRKLKFRYITGFVRATEVAATAERNDIALPVTGEIHL
jgi:hypothetical protein